MLWCTGQPRAAASNSARSGWSSASGIARSTSSRRIRRGVSSDMNFRTFTSSPSSAISFRFATIPITVAMHAPSAVATRSVGENDSPRPLLSTGASVVRVLPDGPCVATQCRSPS